MFKKKLLFVLLLFALFYYQTSAQKSLTYADFIERIYDMEYLATIPEKGEESGNFSSYDRRSIYDEATQTYTSWDANKDGSGYIRREGNDIVIFEKDGPGVIWRFWSALAKEGHIKIFIDHNEKPVIDKPFRAFFETVEGETPPLNYPNLVMTLSRGRNHFLPIPFNKHCKITLSENWGAYYHITHTSFPEPTTVLSYSATFTKEENIAMAKADRILSNRGYSRKKYSNENLNAIDLEIEPGKETLIKKITGNKAIANLQVKLNEESIPYGPEFLKDIWLSITRDDDKNPAVLAPIGMFFGTYPEIYPYRALPLGVFCNSFYSNWWMPFSKSATLKLISKSDKNFTIRCTVVSVPIKESADNLLRFHAKWHDGSLYQSDNNSPDRGVDWTFFKTQGKGRYCGLTLHVKNIWEEPVEEPETWWYGKWDKKTIDWWWGEGDEKFFVDGEKFPSTFGTGSEDYIGYAWSAEPPFPTFDSPFASQPYTAINGNGHTVVNRFHIADNIPFQHSFEGRLEKYKPNKWGPDNYCLYDVTVYWYQMAD